MGPLGLVRPQTIVTSRAQVNADRELRDSTAGTSAGGRGVAVRRDRLQAVELRARRGHAGSPWRAWPPHCPRRASLNRPLRRPPPPVTPRGARRTLSSRRLAGRTPQGRAALWQPPRYNPPVESRDPSALPGAEIILNGLRDLERGQEWNRFAREHPSSPEHRLYALLSPWMPHRLTAGTTRSSGASSASSGRSHA